MAYAVLADILKELDESVLVELTDDPENPIGQVDQAAVDSAIERAGAIMDGHLAVRYETPVEAGEVVKNLCVDLAIYTLFTRRENVPKYRQDRYSLAIRMLKDIAEGFVSLGNPTPPVGETPAQYPVTSSPSADFDSDVWDCF